MMCAYLKMNLSTKEIAPLLNISVRGVGDDPVSSAQEVRSGTGRQFDRLLKQLPLTQIVAPTDSETDYFSESVVVTYQTNVPFII